jgi:hypothetical protein
VPGCANGITIYAQFHARLGLVALCISPTAAVAIPFDLRSELGSGTVLVFIAVCASAFSPEWGRIRGTETCLSERVNARILLELLEHAQSLRMGADSVSPELIPGAMEEAFYWGAQPKATGSVWPANAGSRHGLRCMR